jgi:hypothetical protein
MSISDTRAEVEAALLAFAWDEWAQMGVLASPTRTSPWAQDPEALLGFTLELARADPRLFDEVLDWLVVNEHLISVRRLRSVDAPDPRPRWTPWRRRRHAGSGHGMSARRSRARSPQPFTEKLESALISRNRE